MDWSRIRHTIALLMILNPTKRARYIQKHNVFHHMGDNCMIMFRKIPLYPKLISFGNNVWVASYVTFITHDAIHYMLNNRQKSCGFREYIGCIDIGDNVFIGSNSTILPNVKIGSDTIVAAGTLVNRNIRGGVYAGVPAKYICSFDEFVEKRRNSQNINIGMSEEALQSVWESFNSTNCE